ncbi:MAG: hypothetical protein LBD93_11295, partial [Treponema sp.]|nr:hypothetical protein [Treponema sp.]
MLSVRGRRLGTRNMFNAAIINLVTWVQEAGASANYQSLEDGIFAIEKLEAALSGKGWERSVSSAADFNQAIAAINADIGGGDYTITLKADRGATAITFTGTVAKRIILKGV